MNKIKYIALFILFLPICGGCSESECSVGERICEGNVSRTCYNGRWRDVTCVKTKPICDEKYGCVSVESVCGNGNLEPEEACDGSNLNNKTCNDIFEGLVGTLRCSETCAFDTSSCMVPGCSDGMAACANNKLQSCENGTWHETDCGGDICNAARKSCITRECADGARRCDGTQAQLCIDGAYVVAMDCAQSGLICDSASGLCANRVCEDGTRRCDGTRMELCVGNAYAVVMDCAEKGQICAESDGTCADAPQQERAD